MPRQYLSDSTLLVTPSSQCVATRRHLDLAGNDMNREGSEAVAAYLAKNKTLLTLSLSNNPIRDMGAKSLATVSVGTCVSILWLCGFLYHFWRIFVDRDVCWDFTEDFDLFLSLFMYVVSDWISVFLKKIFFFFYTNRNSTIWMPGFYMPFSCTQWLVSICCFVVGFMAVVAQAIVKASLSQVLMSDQGVCLCEVAKVDGKSIVYIQWTLGSQVICAKDDRLHDINDNHQAA